MILGYVIALILLVVVSAFCSCSETVFFSQNPLQVRRFAQRHPHTGARLQKLLASPQPLLSAILILNTIVNVAIAAVGYQLARQFIPRYAEEVSTVLTTIFLLIFGEYGPKRVGLMFTETLTRLFTPVMEAVIVFVTPLRWLLQKVTGLFEPIFRVRGQALSDEEIRTAFEVSGADGIMDAEEYSMVKAIIGLEHMRVADVMTPRVDLIGIDLESDPAGWLDHVRGARRKHLLAYRGQLDEVAGLLDVRKYLLDPEHRIEPATLTPIYVPKTVPLNRLLAVFRKERRDIAVVIDEFGGTSGVVTVGDILERVSGDVYQELAKPRPVFQEVGPGRWLVDAQFRVGDLNRSLDLKLTSEGGERLSGWLAHHMGRVPMTNEVVEAEGVRVTVLKTDKTRVTLAQIQRMEGGAA